jgi:DNA modification methylase
MGSGTTAAVADRLNRLYLGCELNQDYEKLQKERLKQRSLELL